MTKVRLSRHARTISGSGFPLDEQGLNAGDLPFVKVSDLALEANREGVETAANWVSSATARSLGARVVPPGAVIFPKVGAALLGNARGLTKRSCLLDNNMMAVAPITGLPRYWFYLLSSVDMGPMSGGGTLPFVTDTQVRDLYVWVPSTEEQRRIADFLDDQVDRMENAAKSAAGLPALAQKRLASALDLLLMPHGEPRLLAAVTDPTRPIQYGIVLPGPDFEGGVPIVKGGDVAAHRMSVDQLSRTDPAIEAEYSRSRLREGDLLIAIRGSVGELATVPAELEGANITQDAARIAPYGCDRSWLRWLLQAPEVQGRIARMVTGATVRGINIGDLRRIVIPVPSRSTQESLGRQAEDLARLSATLVAWGDKLSDLISERRSALITACVTGEFDVSTAGNRAADAALQGVAR